MPANLIVAENQFAGTPQSTWGVSGAGDSTIQGFATDISVNHGQTVNFKINDSANKPYHIDIYRMGYYQGNGARLVTTIPNTQVLRQVQPNALKDTATGLVDAGNWAVSASWAVPASAVSGLYFARLTREDTGGASLIYFVVRDDDGASDLLFQTADTTWQAYNTWGGYSLYQYTNTPATVTANSPSDPGRAVKVSYNRPLTIDGVTGGYGTYNSPLHAEYPMIRWLEANGYNVSYSTDVDSDRRGLELREHKAFLSVGHDEYWSGGQRANVEAARDAGVDLAFFSGNECFWKVRWENSIDASGTPYRTLVCYKESKDGAKIDPTSTWTGTWRDSRFSPPADGGRPENGMSGTMYMNDRTSTDLGVSLTVSATDGDLRFWRNTSVANLTGSQTATLGQFVVGYEVDEDLDNGFRPPGLMTMSSTTFNTSSHVNVPWGTEVGPGTGNHKITLYRAASGALVFGAGTIQWSWGLDGTHNDGSSTPSVPMQQATVNLFADMGVQPGSLQSGLLAATASTDATAPTSTITSPAAGTVVQVGQAVTISGTVADAGGGLVGGVEVSTDGGTTWHPAVGRTTWTYAWTPAYSGTAVIKSRAVDDSGNTESPSAGVSVTVSSSNTLAAAYSFDAGTGSTVADTSGKGNTGTISGATWSIGKFGNALSFNGTNSWVTVADSNSLDLTGGMTLEAWVNPTTINGWECVVMKEAAADLSYALYGDNNGNDAGGPRRPIVSLRQGGNTYWTPGGAQLALNTWTHLAATYDGSTLRMYVNGALASSLSVSATITTSTNPLRIGGDSVWGEYFSGKIDEVRIYSRALVPSEIQNDMNTPIGIVDTTAPTAPTNLSATGGIGSIALSWTSSTDNVGVANYNVHRSTTPNFTPSTANRIAQPTSTSYTDSGRAAGTYYYRVTAQDAAGNVSASSNEASGTATADTVAPTVSITAPANNATVTGTVAVTANASDNVGVAGVQFKLDGANLGAEVTAAPYSVNWDTTSAVNGAHSLIAVARDAAGNSTSSAAVNVTVSNQPSTGLVAAYGFNEGTGTTTADASGTGNTGTLSNATWSAAGKYGKALSFNGTNSWVTVADSNSLDLTTGMTLEAWVNPAAIDGWECVLLKQDSTDLAYALYGDNNGNDVGQPRRPGASVRQGSVTSWTPGSAQLSLNTWTHLAATYDGANLKFYVNATLATSLALTGPINTTAGVLRIGGDSVWGEYFNGLIDEVRVYHRALTQSQIQTDMNTAIGATDTTPPTAPSNLTASGGVGSVSLSWSAATDNVGVTNYNVYRSTTSGFTPSAANRIAQPTGTNYTDSGLAAGTYYYKVTAQDGAGNIGPASNEASGTATADTQAPTAPANLTATGGVGSISLNWTASTDNVGVANYNVHRSTTANFTPTAGNRIAQPIGTSFTDSGLAAGTYYYRVTAQDAAGNVSTSSNEASATATADTGLVAAYGFNEGTGTTAADASGRGNIGTLSNATWSASGKYGKALSFNGVNAWVTVADAASLDLTGALTLEAWVNPIAIVAGRSVILKEAGTEEVYSLYADENLPRPLAAVRINSAYKTTTGTTQLPINTWTHLASSYDGATLRLYVNGTQVGSAPASGSIEVSSGVLRIGGNAIWGEYFSGLIDEVRIYSRALTQAQIQTDMSTPVGSPELLMGAEVPASDGAPFSQEELRPLFDEAVKRWSAALDDTTAVEHLRGVQVEVMDLPGTTLGLASASVIYLDTDGAGHGWFLDPTPRDDSEFAAGLADNLVSRQVDLLTVITHEMGHVLGLDDDSETNPLTGNVMADVLPLGVRRIHLNSLVFDVALSSAAPMVTDTASKVAGGSAPNGTFAALTNERTRVANPPGAPLDRVWNDRDWLLAPTAGSAKWTVRYDKQKRMVSPIFHLSDPIFEDMIEIITGANRASDDPTSAMAIDNPSPSWLGLRKGRG